jgi:hypothetical protein
MLAIVPSAMLDADGNQQEVVTAENKTNKRFFVSPWFEVRVRQTTPRYLLLFSILATGHVF